MYSQQPQAQFYSQQPQAHFYSQQGMPSSQEGQVHSQQIWPDSVEAVNLGDP